VLVPVVVLAAAASVGAWLATRPGSAPSYRLVAASTTTLSEDLSATGTIEPQSTGTLSFSAPGQVTAVDVGIGQHVTDGETLATMSSPTLDEQVAQAQETLDSDESRLAQDEGSGASSEQIDADQAAVNADQSPVTSAGQALAGARLVSPVNGIVTTVGYTAGEQVSGDGGGSAGSGGSGGDGGSSSPASSSPSITVVSDTDVVNASVDASVVDEVKAGDSAVITPEGGGATVSGTVASVGLTASTSTGVAMFPVVVDVTGSTSGLYAGASASVSVVYQQVPDALVVPAAAVQPGPGGDSTVLVMSGGQQVSQRVTTGITSGGLTQITSGLSQGEQVVVTIVQLGTVSTGGGNGGPVFVGPGVGKFRVFNQGGAPVPGGG
jgi:membrane fusion protein, macrolide-specific efflux system